MKRRKSAPVYDPYTPDELWRLRKLDLSHNRRWFATMDVMWEEAIAMIQKARERKESYVREERGAEGAETSRDSGSLGDDGYDEIPGA